MQFVKKCNLIESTNYPQDVFGTMLHSRLPQGRIDEKKWSVKEKERTLTPATCIDSRGLTWVTPDPACMFTGLWAPAMGEESMLLEFSIGEEAILVNPGPATGMVVVFIPRPFPPGNTRTPLSPPGTAPGMDILDWEIALFDNIWLHGCIVGCSSPVEGNVFGTLYLPSLEKCNTTLLYGLISWSTPNHYYSFHEESIAIESAGSRELLCLPRKKMTRRSPFFGQINFIYSTD